MIKWKNHISFCFFLHIESILWRNQMCLIIFSLCLPFFHEKIWYIYLIETKLKQTQYKYSSYFLLIISSLNFILMENKLLFEVTIEEFSSFRSVQKLFFNFIIE